eukprot:NODE_830_length_3646_cov_0.455314.p1 type:complete len:690 gc:universal NODE_830_length_3646_cov_0.455314:3134-1065(-)
MLHLRLVPTEFKAITIIALYKLKGNRANAKNYRPIDLLCFIRRFFEKSTDKFLPDTRPHNIQYGFRPAGSIHDAVSLLEKYIKNVNNLGLNLYISFYDIQKAYDSLSRKHILAYLVNAPRNLGLVYAQLIRKQQLTLQIGSIRSISITTTCGVPQGGVTSGKLFTSCLQPIYNLIHSLDALLQLFADDTMTATTTATKLKRCIQNINIKLSELGLETNASKCVIITNDKTITEMEGISVATESIRYLGYWFNEQGIDIEEQFKRTRKSLNCRWNQLKQIGLFSGGLPLSVSANLLTAHFTSITEFSFHSILYPDKYINRMQIFYKKRIKSLIGAPYRFSTQVLTQLVQYPNLKLRNQYLYDKHDYHLNTQNGIKNKIFDEFHRRPSGSFKFHKLLLELPINAPHYDILLCRAKSRYKSLCNVNNCTQTYTPNHYSSHFLITHSLLFTSHIQLPIDQANANTIEKIDPPLLIIDASYFRANTLIIYTDGSVMSHHTGFSFIILSQLGQTKSQNLFSATLNWKNVSSFFPESAAIIESLYYINNLVNNGIRHLNYCIYSDNESCVKIFAKIFTKSISISALPYFKLYSHVEQFSHLFSFISISHVKAHSGIHPNEVCDYFAKYPTNNLALHVPLKIEFNNQWTDRQPIQWSRFHRIPLLEHYNQVLQELRLITANYHIPPPPPRPLQGLAL